MASLLERMDVVPAGRGVGPVRNRGGRAGAKTPYARGNHAHSKADADAMWQHDMYNGPGKTLSSRLTDPSTSAVGPPRRINTTGAVMALRKAVGLPGDSARGLTIKGASGANVVQVQGLVSGTTAADVEAIFKRCGDIIESSERQGKDGVIVRLTFKTAADAKVAVSKFDGQSADGRTLGVSIVGSRNATLGGRLAGSVSSDTVDHVLDDLDSGTSKMRSDDVLLSDPRAQVLTVPPGLGAAEQRQSQPWVRGRGRRGRQNHRGGHGAGASTKMDLD